MSRPSLSDPPARSAPVLLSRHVLIVDDDADFGASLSDMLAFHGYRVSLANQPARARELLTMTDIEVALIDLRLGRTSGLTLLSDLQRQHPNLVTVLMTACASADTVIEALREGAYDYLRKPFHPNELFVALQRAFERIDLKRAKQQTEQALRRSEERYRLLYDNNPSMYFTVAADTTILLANRFGAEQLGYSVVELVGQPLARLYADVEPAALQRYLHTSLSEPSQIHRWEQRLTHKDGSLLWVRQTARAVSGADNHPTILLVCEDITEAHRLSASLSYQASHDTLTGLYNRREFERRLRRLLKSIPEQPSAHALCYLDLDQFKVINDTCGHAAGDDLLKQLGAQLQKQVRPQDTLARVGGDEFAVLVTDCTADEAMQVADTLRKTIAEFRFVWHGRGFGIGVSIGLVPLSVADGSVSGALRMADTACYTAKDKGRNRIHVYHEGDTELLRRHREMRWVNQVQWALEENRLELYFQPIVPLAGTDSRRHYELLLRLRDERGRLVTPGQFLPAAERYNLATPLDRWVVHSMFTWLRKHPDQLAALHLCSINLSGHSLGDEAFLHFLSNQLKEEGILPDKICFEITETAAIANFGVAIRFIEQLRGLGCRFALDDFGRGLSSFAYLKTLPVDFIKIDGLFVKGILSDTVDLAMVKSINDIAHVMGKQTIAEFVENTAMFTCLQELGVDYAQGYGIGAPQPLTQLLDDTLIPP